MKTDATKHSLKGYLPTLDGWRAVAISVVLIYHARDSIVLAWGDRFGVLSRGWWGVFGVDLFFAISGLLITSRLLANETETGTLGIKSFYIRRAFRILPPSLTYLAVILILRGVGIIWFPLNYWVAALLFYMNFTAGPLNFVADPQWYIGHFWTLAVEEHFYAVWPATLHFLKNQRRLAVALLLCLLLTIWRCLNIKFSAIATTVGLGYFEHQGRTDFVVDRILWGATIALAYHRYADQRWVQRLLTLPVGFAMSIAVVGSLTLDPRWKAGQALLLMRMVFVPIVLLITIINCRGVVALILENTGIKWVGKLSYSLYLWNQLFLVWGLPATSRLPWPHRWPENLVCTFGCAIASYYLVERPFIKVGHRIDQNLFRRVPSVHRTNQ